MPRPALSTFSLLLLTLGIASGAELPEFPKTLDDRTSVSLFAAEPDIVTPVGAAVDAKGRLLVIESQSHFRPKDYIGPATDRIRVFEDTTGKGKADKVTTLYEGTNFLMNLVVDRDGSVVVSSRTEIFRIDGVDTKQNPPRRDVLAKLDSKDDYPHNGLHGLAIDSNGDILFGIGENHAMEWKLTGTDGKSLTDANGSGSVFRMDGKGKNLTRVSHGFWNPFGLGFDPAGNLWAVDNDPDGRPPCRLIHVVPGGDFGFEFRYGRTGLHPLQAWDGELPGTLRMAAGVGEAPCAVLWHQGRLVVTSWRDHQVESHTLVPRGATFGTTMKKILTGGPNFRPVGLAAGKDGSIFVTDWGSGSYPIHGHGRIWKITFADAAKSPADAGVTTLSNDATKRAAALRQSTDLGTLVESMGDADPSIAQAAQWGLSRLPQVEKLEWSAMKSPRQKIGLLAALLMRGSSTAGLIKSALSDSDDHVRQMAVRAITEQAIKDAQPMLEESLKSQTLSPRLLGMTAAAIGLLNGDKSAKIDAGKINAILLERMNAPGASDATKAGALQMMQASHPKIPLDQIKGMLSSKSDELQRQAVRYLNADTDVATIPLLVAAANNEASTSSVRAEAIAALIVASPEQIDLLLKYVRSDDAALRRAALRSLGLRPRLTAAQQDILAKAAARSQADSDLVNHILGKWPPPRPAVSDLAAWNKIIDAAPGDPEAGRRVFFHLGGAGCFMCHVLEGRGRSIGPDLTMIGHSRTRQHVLESILDPSREIAPLFTLWTITLKTGDKVHGILLRRETAAKEIYTTDALGKEIVVLEKDVVDRKARSESFMPAGMVQTMTDQELRDVIALLMQKR